MKKELKSTQKYKLVVCGGTFDHFHKGHREFVRFALNAGQKVIIGVTSNSFIRKNKFHQEGMESYKKRKTSLYVFLKKEKVLDKIEITPIDDIFGPTLSKNLKIEAIVVSQNLIKNVAIINRQRKKVGLSALKILVYPMVLGEDGKEISSSRIRDGEINREGKPYLNPDWFSSKLMLSSSIRKKLKKPLGTLLKKGTINFAGIGSQRVITVGDVVTKYFNEKHLVPKIAVVDFYVKRRKKFSNLAELGFPGEEKVLKADNPAKCLTPGLFRKVSEVFLPQNKDKRVVIKVNGEEDLAVLPLVLAAPLGFSIFYGQPGEGVVRVDISEKTKEKIYALVNQFTQG